MTKLKKTLVIVLTFIMVLTLMPVQTKAAKKVKLNKSKLSLKVGKSFTLKLKNAKSKKVKWSSSKKKIATVSKNGKVKAKKKGSCKITAKYKKKKYVCKVTVKKKTSNKEDNQKDDDVSEDTIKYGSVSGNITYFYNNYRGNVADTGAKVILLSTSGSGKQMPNLSTYVEWAMPSTINQYNKYGVYATEVDGVGHYAFNNVKVGDYKIVILSRNTTSGSAFDNEELYASSLSSFASAYVNANNANMLGKYIGYNKYKTGDVSVRENQTFSFGYDFGITYI